MMRTDAPPAYAWDWVARQRPAWREIRRRLLARGTPPAAAEATARTLAGDVPDWAPDHHDVVGDLLPRRPAPGGAATDGAGQQRDYAVLDTRADVIAALRTDYPGDATVRAVVDEVITAFVFLDRLDATSQELGVRTAPRGMRWWWSHLTGRPLPEAPSAPSGTSEHASDLPLQLRLVDVLTGYGDVPER